MQNQEPDLKGILPNFVNYETDPSLKHATPHTRVLSTHEATFVCRPNGRVMLMGVACHVLRVRYVSVCVSHGA